MAVRNTLRESNNRTFVGEREDGELIVSWNQLSGGKAPGHARKSVAASCKDNKILFIALLGLVGVGWWLRNNTFSIGAAEVAGRYCSAFSLISSPIHPRARLSLASAVTVFPTKSSPPVRLRAAGNCLSRPPPALSVGAPCPSPRR